MHYRREYDTFLSMAKRHGSENLTKLTTEEARKRGSNGGKASVESRRKKKMLSELYADILSDRLTIQDQDFEPGDFVKLTALKILARGDSASATMLKEIREATEGNKLQLSGELAVTIIDDIK